MSWMLASSDEFIDVTPNNTKLLTYPNDQGDEITRKCKGIYIGNSGDLAIVNSAGVTVIHKNVPIGFWPFSTSIIKSTGTTATEIIAYF